MLLFELDHAIVFIDGSKPTAADISIRLLLLLSIAAALKALA